MVFLSFQGTAHKERFGALREHAAKIASTAKRTLSWVKRPHESEVILTRDGDFDVAGPESDFEAVRRWMAENLVRLRNAIRPHLDSVMAAEAEAAEPAAAATAPEAATEASDATH